MIPRICRLLWLACLALFIAVALFPVSNRMTRTAGIILAFLVWFGLIALCWRQRVLRFSLIIVTVGVAGFLAMPASSRPSTDLLRTDYVTGLQRYKGVTYYWGGESPTGIDCSGLIRRGLVDALVLRGICSGDAGLVRQAFVLWWNDCTAKVLGEAKGNLTVGVVEAGSLNGFDHSLARPGDLAVTQNGIHILAYVGNAQWIQADPGAGKVIAVTAPSKENAWFSGPMRIVRWKLLAD